METPNVGVAKKIATPAEDKDSLVIDMAKGSDTSEPVQKESAYLPVYFDYDKAELTAEAKQTLSTMSSNFKGTLLVSGHCDERGSDAYNDTLGMRRAETAKEYLLQHGFKSGLIKTQSFGKRHPVKSNCKDEACHAQNRRAEFKVIP